MKSPLQLRTLTSLFLLLAAFSITSAQDNYPEMKQWESFDFVSKRLSAADVPKVTPENLELMRGVVSASTGASLKTGKSRAI